MGHRGRRFAGGGTHETPPRLWTGVLALLTGALLVAAPAGAAVPTGMGVTVSGTVDDPQAAVQVNGVPATVGNGGFQADGVELPLGPQQVTATATDAAGNPASVMITVWVDLPETLKTPRFSCLVKGSVDDSTATVTVNGLAASVQEGTFSAVLPLVAGVNTLTAVAADPAGNAGETFIRVFVPPEVAVSATAPVITEVEPAEGTFVYADVALSVRVDAVDADGDPIDSRVLVDGLVVRDWARTLAHTWTPAQAELGARTLTVEVRDPGGSSSARQVALFVLRHPVVP